MAQNQGTVNSSRNQRKVANQARVFSPRLPPQPSQLDEAAVEAEIHNELAIHMMRGIVIKNALKSLLFAVGGENKNTFKQIMLSNTRRRKAKRDTAQNK